jgi:hypothetical protein
MRQDTVERALIPGITGAESGSRKEAALVAVLGPALALTSFPFFIWRGFGVDLAHVAGGALLLVVAVRSLSGRHFRPPRTLAFGAAALLAVPLAAFAFARLPGFSVHAFVRTWLHLAFLVAVFLAVASSALSKRQFESVLAVYASSAVAVSLYGAWQTLAFARGWPTGIELLNSLAVEPLNYPGIWRATSVLLEPGWLAIFLLAPAACAFALAVERFSEGRHRAAFGWLTALAVIAGGVVPTGSVGGILSMTLLLLGMAVVGAKRLVRRQAVALAAVVAAVAFGGALFVSRSEAPLARWMPGYSSRGVHLGSARYALAVFRESPIIGIGVGQFAPVGTVRGQQLGFSLDVFENGPLVGLTGFLAEFGVVGVLAAAFLLWRVVTAGSRAAAFSSLAGLLVAAVLLKEAYSGFYIHFWTWFPLGIAALSRLRGHSNI